MGLEEAKEAKKKATEAAKKAIETEQEKFRPIFLFIFARKVFRGDFDTGRRGYFTTMKSDYVAIEILGLYWHFVDLVWVFIFAFFYLW